MKALLKGSLLDFIFIFQEEQEEAYRAHPVVETDEGKGP